jgi:hypothetical protein
VSFVRFRAPFSGIVVGCLKINKDLYIFVILIDKIVPLPAYTLSALHYTTLHTLHFTALHCTALLRYTTLHRAVAFHAARFTHVARCTLRTARCPGL